MARFDRPAELQAAYEDYVDSADVLYGVPDQSGRALARTVAANPRLRWVHTIPAGGGQQVRAARLDRADSGPHPVHDLGRRARRAARRSSRCSACWPARSCCRGCSRRSAVTSGRARRVMPIASDLTVAIVGLGSIGRLTAAKLAGLGYRVVGVHRRPVEVPGVSRVYGVDQLAEVAAARRRARARAARHRARPRRCSAARCWRRRKPGITIVNVGRGTTVDEPALIDALADGRVGFAVARRDRTPSRSLPTARSGTCPT